MIRGRIYYDVLPIGQFWRIPHDIERMNWNAKDYRYRGSSTGWARIVRDEGGNQIFDPFPEVYRFAPDHHTILDCFWQQIWWDMNPTLSAKKMSTLYGNALALMNNTGFPGKRNCMTGDDADKSFPRFDAARTCGGAIHRGVQDGNVVHFESMNVNDHPRVGYILDSPWLWYYLVSVNPHGEVNYITRENMYGVRVKIKVPFVTAQPVRLPVNELSKLERGQFPEADFLS